MDKRRGSNCSVAQEQGLREVRKGDLLVAEETIAGLLTSNRVYSVEGTHWGNLISVRNDTGEVEKYRLVYFRYYVGETVR